MGRMTLSKVLITPFFGDLPPWMEQYWSNAERLKEQGYNFLLDNDEDAFRDRVRERLGIQCPPMAGTGNVWDFRPALGYLYEKEIRDYHFWGVTDFDCVYGRVEEFYPDSELALGQVFTDHWDYLCGPWTLFRNTPDVNEVFFQSGRWEQSMESSASKGWMEAEFTQIANECLSVRYTINHAWENPEQLRMDEEGRLLHGSVHEAREIPFFHFRRSKIWPL
jgi:hypothetical protein